ncbi:MAG: ABC transporter permease, partial [Rhodospirillaceae bacterium]|nr:ABC transporter permease [Rhodospirillaceae bacterium]
MLRYIAHRLLIMVPTLIAISFIVFVVIQLPPGDYLTTLIEELRELGEPADLKQIEALREEYGLNQPFLVQHVQWVF